MGEERDELLFAMYLAARGNALEHLREGVERCSRWWRTRAVTQG